MWFKIQLYIVSLLLLFILVFINKINIPLCLGKDCECIGLESFIEINKANGIILILSILMIFLGLVFYLVNFQYFIRGNKHLPEEIKQIENVNWEHLTFLTTYIIPFVTFNFNEDKNELILFILLVIIGCIYIKTNIFHTNPTLALLGYNIYKVSTENRKNIIIISKRTLTKEDKIRVKLLSDNIYIADKILK